MLYKVFLFAVIAAFALLAGADTNPSGFATSVKKTVPTRDALARSNPFFNSVDAALKSASVSDMVKADKASEFMPLGDFKTYDTTNTEDDDSSSSSSSSSSSDSDTDEGDSSSSSDSDTNDEDKETLRGWDKGYSDGWEDATAIISADKAVEGGKGKVLIMTLACTTGFFGFVSLVYTVFWIVGTYKRKVQRKKAVKHGHTEDPKVMV